MRPAAESDVVTTKSETPGGAEACPGVLTVRSRLQAVTYFGTPNSSTTMPLTNQQLSGAAPHEALLRVTSLQRFQTYLTAAGHNQDRAWNLYLWNAKLGEAFHLPIQTVEVCVRNSIDHALRATYGPNWGQEKTFLHSLDERQIKDLELVKQRIRNRNLPFENGQVVAGLSFGFWVGMLQKRYNPSIWSRQLRSAFPHLPPNKGRKSLTETLRRNTAAAESHFSP